MSRSTLLIILSVLILVGLGGRFFVKKSTDYEDEKEWFVNNLNYDFVLRVDSVVNVKEGKGFLICTLDSGKLATTTEDSLNLNLSYYKKLKFLRHSSAKEVRIFSAVTGVFRKNDRVYVNSSENAFIFFRDQKIIRRYKLDEAIAERYF
jgi:hypothetical protein